MSRIELNGVSKKWGDVTAVEPTDLSIGDGEFVAILGPSGCGKSTTLFMLAGIYTPSDGDIRFDGAVINEVEARDRNVGIVFQSYALYPHMTVRENILFPLRFKKVAQGRGRAPGRGRRQAGAGAGTAGPASRAIVGWPATARRARPSPREGAEAPAPRRAPVEPRRLAAPDDAQRDPQPATYARRDHDPRHPRPDRGDDDGRPGHLHEQGPDRADRHGGRPLPPAAEPVRRKLHRVAPHQPARRIGAMQDASRSARRACNWRGRRAARWCSA